MKNYFLPESFIKKDSGRNQICRVMKLITCSLLLCSCFALAGQANSQNAKVSLNKNQVQLEDILNEIENQTDYLFISNRDVNLKQKVSISASDKLVQDVLNEILKNTELTFTIEGVNIILTRKDENMLLVQQQDKNISGKVVDQNGEPIIGVNVVEKGTTNGVISDLEGSFSLNVASNATLVFSYIGYKSQEIKIDNRLLYNVVLKEDAEALDEVVVVGYGTALKKDISGSVVRADLDVLKESPNVSFASALQGTVPGMNVGAVTQAGTDPEMTIRGRTSISGANSPLIVLDGIIYRGNLVDLNMNDIESIDILKDASSAAIYGSQASNGVLLITSKNVKAMSKPIIEYNGSFSIQQSANKINLNDREGYLQQIADVKISESRMGEDLLTPNPDWDVTKYFQDNLETEGFLNGRNTDWWDLGTNNLPYKIGRAHV